MLSISTCSFIITVFFFFSTAGSIAALSRFDFPAGFVFGAGTSAYQVEGAAAEDGRKPCVFDTFTHSGGSPDNATGDIASDQYHKYKDDVKLMHKMGLDAYRFSISWSRLIPDGRGAVNPKGLNYYNNLIDELISYGIEPHVTLLHLDLPQILQDEYEGFQNQKFIADFAAYADVCFKEYGDRVKTWMTINEPNIPGNIFNNCSDPFDFNCTISLLFAPESFAASHIKLLAHATAVQLYRTKYQEKQKGQIGITLIAIWFEPLTNSPLDIDAAERALASVTGWFMHPLVYGKYSTIMKKYFGSLLPPITEKESKKLKGSFDFIGLNYYLPIDISVYRRVDTNKASFINGISVRGFTTQKADQKDVPGLGLQKILNHFKHNYENPALSIHENGYKTNADDPSNPATHVDTERINYLQGCIRSLLPSIRNGSNIRGYFVWSLLDCFEVFGGYNSRYGLYGVDFSVKDRRRYPRQSAHWYSSFLAKTERKTETTLFLSSE